MCLSKVIRSFLLFGAATSAAIGGITPSYAQFSGNTGVLTAVQGTTSDSVVVSVDRAVVMESAVQFVEVSVANPRIADVAALSNSTLYILGKATGRTTLTLFGEGGQLITNVDIRVSPDIAEFKERLQDILPNEAIEVRTANTGIVLSGQVSGAAKITRAIELAERYAPENVTNLLTVGGTQQVMLKVRFAEMQRSVAKQLNSSLITQGVSGNFTTQTGTQTLISGDNFANATDGDAGTAVQLAGGTLGAFRLDFGAGGLAATLLLEALETKGMVRTLAEPNIVALSGQQASFLAGGEYPIPVSTNDGITVEYRPFGVELEFIPTVLDEDLINLQIKSSVSAIDTTVAVTADNVTVNAFSKREAQTVVEMRDGQSFAIAGLLQDDFNDSVGQVPWLGDIPILGALFRSADFSRRQSELVVLITPHLVSPSESDAFTLPTDRVQLPNEKELFLYGITESSPDVSAIASQDFQGRYGYVLE